MHGARFFAGIWGLNSGELEWAMVCATLHLPGNGRMKVCKACFEFALSVGSGWFFSFCLSAALFSGLPWQRFVLVYAIGGCVVSFVMFFYVCIYVAAIDDRWVAEGKVARCKRSAALSVDVGALGRLRAPVILFMDEKHGGHFVVLRGVHATGEVSALVDPAWGNVRLVRAQFLKRWRSERSAENTGRILLVLESGQPVNDQFFGESRARRQRFLLP
ncbi:cysteine peptidase family C39 domain-containing protein [Camelimonas sp. ID_303_24]